MLLETMLEASANHLNANRLGGLMEEIPVFRQPNEVNREPRQTREHF